MATFVLSAWNGQVHVAVEFGAPKSDGGLSRELARIELNAREAAMPFPRLRLRFRDAIQRAEARLAA